MKRLSLLWTDQTGFVVSSELVLVATIVVIGLLVGLATIRDQVLQELADAADAISEVDQSYVFSGMTGHAVSTSGTVFGDSADYCENTAPGSDQSPGNPPECIEIELIDPAVIHGGEGPGL